VSLDEQQYRALKANKTSDPTLTDPRSDSRKTRHDYEKLPLGNTYIAQSLNNTGTANSGREGAD